MERVHKNPYANALRLLCRKGDAGEILDRLFVSALIEARSCERFKLLSERLADETLRAFYRELMESEARHYRLFCGLCEELFGVKQSRSRLEALARREADVVSSLLLGPKVHG